MFHHCGIYVRDLREGAFSSPPHPRAASKGPILNRVKESRCFIIELKYSGKIRNYIRRSIVIPSSELFKKSSKLK